MLSHLQNPPPRGASQRKYIHRQSMDMEQGISGFVLNA